MRRIFVRENVRDHPINERNAKTVSFFLLSERLFTQLITIKADQQIGQILYLEQNGKRARNQTSVGGRKGEHRSRSYGRMFDWTFFDKLMVESSVSEVDFTGQRLVSLLGAKNYF